MVAWRAAGLLLIVIIISTTKGSTGVERNGLSEEFRRRFCCFCNAGSGGAQVGAAAARVTSCADIEILCIVSHIIVVVMVSYGEW